MIKHQSQTSTCPSVSSSESPSLRLSCTCLQLALSCTCLHLYMSAHASPFAIRVHFGTLQERTHFQANNSKTASDLVLAATASSEWRACHHNLSIHTWQGRALWDEHADIISRLLPGSWLEGGARRDKLCMVVADCTQSLPFWPTRADSAGRSPR